MPIKPKLVTCPRCRRTIPTEQFRLHLAIHRGKKNRFIEGKIKSNEKKFIGEKIDMTSEEIMPDLDYEGMYEGLIKEKLTYKEQLHRVVISSILLEFMVNSVVDVWTKKIESAKLKKWANSLYVPVNTKILMLRFANIINEDLLNNMSILFKIRNSFAHKIIMGAEKGKTEFAPLKDAVIENAFLKGLPDDAIKFQLLASQCMCFLDEKSKRIDPSSVMEMELAEGATFEPLE